MSTDVGKLLGARGYLDFYLYKPYSWGFELVRDEDRLQDHLDRFTESGMYFGLLRNGCLKDYVILDFRMNSLSEHMFDEDKHLIHVYFSADFKTTYFSDLGICNGSYSIAKRGDARLRTKLCMASMRIAGYCDAQLSTHLCSPWISSYGY